MSRAINDLTGILNKLSKTVQSAIDRVAMQAVGDFANNLIVKRTRLGYGVATQFGSKFSFQSQAPLSPLYVLARSKQSSLDSTTRPKKSNLTNTGQMLRSMKAQYKSKGVIIITPTGSRNDGLTNLEVAGFASDDPGKRPFNRLSALEFQQVLRFYRKTFGDLIKKSSNGSLIR